MKPWFPARHVENSILKKVDKLHCIILRRQIFDLLTYCHVGAMDLMISQTLTSQYFVLYIINKDFVPGWYDGGNTTLKDSILAKIVYPLWLTPCM